MPLTATTGLVLLRRLPLGTNGLSLGLCGLAGIVNVSMPEDWILRNLLYDGTMGLATLLWVAFTCRLFAARWEALAMEFTTPQLFRAYGAWQMTFLFVLQRTIFPVLPLVFFPGLLSGSASDVCEAVRGGLVAGPRGAHHS